MDLFGGTGQLGIEALSRGAQRAVFLDQRKEAVALIKKNLTMTRLEQRGRVFQRDALDYLKSCGEKFDIIFLDPPYATNLLENALDLIAEIDILSKDGIIVCESRPEKVLPAQVGTLEQGRTYRYSKIKVTVYHHKEEMSSPEGTEGEALPQGESK